MDDWWLDTLDALMAAQSGRKYNLHFEPTTTSQQATNLRNNIKWNSQYYLGTCDGGQPGQVIKVDRIVAICQQPIPPGPVILINPLGEGTSNPSVPWMAYAPRINQESSTRVVQNSRRRRKYADEEKELVAIAYTKNNTEFWTKTKEFDVKWADISETIKDYVIGMESNIGVSCPSGFYPEGADGIGQGPGSEDGIVRYLAHGDLSGAYGQATLAITEYDGPGTMEVYVNELDSLATSYTQWTPGSGTLTDSRQFTCRINYTPNACVSTAKLITIRTNKGFKVSGTVVADANFSCIPTPSGTCRYIPRNNGVGAAIYFIPNEMILTASSNLDGGPYNPSQGQTGSLTFSSQSAELIVDGPSTKVFYDKKSDFPEVAGISLDESTLNKMYVDRSNSMSYRINYSGNTSLNNYQLVEKPLVASRVFLSEIIPNNPVMYELEYRLNHYRVIKWLSLQARSGDSAVQSLNHSDFGIYDNYSMQNLDFIRASILTNGDVIKPRNTSSGSTSRALQEVSPGLQYPVGMGLYGRNPFASYEIIGNQYIFYLVDSDLQGIKNIADRLSERSDEKPLILSFGIPISNTNLSSIIQLLNQAETFENVSELGIASIDGIQGEVTSVARIGSIDNF